MQFFMIEKNEEEFFCLFNGKWERRENKTFFYELWIGLNVIQFDSSEIYGNQLTSGRIAYTTIDSNDNRAENLYKEMRKYIKKNYKNKMRAVHITGAEQMCNYFYYSNEVSNWVIEKPDNKLVQFKDSFVKFIPVMS